MSEKFVRIFELSQERNEIADTINELQARKAKIDEAIIKELSKKGIDTVTGNGITTTVVKPEGIEYNPVRARKILKDRFKKILKYSIDPSALATAVANGDVSVDEIKKFTKKVPKKSYIRVTVNAPPE